METRRDYTDELGSPPRGRGKASSGRTCAGAAGITPAWAGKSSNRKSVEAMARDHPRMGGEKSSLLWALSRIQGSPPHGRGKGWCNILIGKRQGITPAWAGKRETPFYRKSISKDHPRMGGEKANGNDAPDDDEGSPPHGQGKDDVFRGQILLPGITPAWAGKRAVFR